MYHIYFKRKTERQFEKLPLKIQDAFYKLAEDLKETGPIQWGWPNFSKLANDEYHCHLSYRYVACWRHERDTITIEVYYVGSREKAPY